MFTNELRRADDRFGESLGGLVNSVVLVVRQVGEKARAPDSVCLTGDGHGSLQLAPIS